MADIGVYVERYTIARSEEMEALLRFGQTAQKLGHRLDVLFRPDMYKIPEYDAIFIRALTDPLNSSYVAARLAELNGLRVIDDPASIRICCDKVNMYGHLQRSGVPMPQTVFLTESEVTSETAVRLLDEMGSPIVLKAPNSSFSMHVERVSTPRDFVHVARRYLRRADRVVAQRFITSEFDWRVGVLGGEALFVCRYLIPRKRWKILTYKEGGGVVSGRVKGVPMQTADPVLIRTALSAAEAIGSGLYGVDLKQVGDDYLVIEVNDNPTIAEGDEDQQAKGLYERVIRYLVGDWG